jgi:uncharacterized membrane protein YhaH (DUF805 family)
MTDYLVFYMIGIALASVIYGFKTPYGDEAKVKNDLVVSSIFWPLWFFAGFGSAFRMFSKRRHAEDISNGAKP